VVARKYRVEKVLGEGGMGRVYRANQLVLEKPVVLKLLHPTLQRDARTVARFQREAKAASRLNHPNSIDVLDFGQTEDGALFIAMEFVDGRDLHQVLSADWPLPEPRVIRIVTQVLSALADAHQAGVIHRDLKPENVLVREGDPPAVKLADFGIARILASDERMTMTGALVGSPHHMAPEIVEGRDADARSDLFSLGTILYWLATGKLPFAAPNPTAILRRVLEGDFEDPRTVEARVPDPLAELVSSCLALDPAGRPQSAAALRDGLDRVLAQVGIERPEEALQEFLRQPEAFKAAFPARATGTLMALGDGALAEGATARALAFYDRVLGLDPGNGAVREKLARISRRRVWRRSLGIGAVALAAGAAVAGAAWLALRARPPEAPQPQAAAALPAQQSSAAVPAEGAGDSTPFPAPELPTPAPSPEAPQAASSAPPTPGRAPGHAATLAVHVRPYAQRALLDGVEVARGEQVVRFTLAPGKAHVVQIEHACCAPFVRQITAEEAAKVGELRIPLEPRPARLRVDGDAATRVFVEGQLLGTAGDSQRTPLTVAVPQGGSTPYEATALIALELAGGARREVRVTLRAGSETIVPGPGAETVVSPFRTDAAAPDLDPNAPPLVPGVEEIK
jgi:serine/threonine-protein kinase